MFPLRAPYPCALCCRCSGITCSQTWARSTHLPSLTIAWCCWRCAHIPRAAALPDQNTSICKQSGLWIHHTSSHFCPEQGWGCWAGTPEVTSAPKLVAALGGLCPHRVCSEILLIYDVMGKQRAAVRGCTAPAFPVLARKWVGGRTHPVMETGWGCRHKWG